MGETFSGERSLQSAPRKSLSFGDSFNKSLQGVKLPDSIEEITFGVTFNQSLDDVKWPSNLQSLRFGPEFNQSLDGVDMPKQLRSLAFGFGFNQCLVLSDLPKTLEILEFGAMFNQSLTGVKFPENLVFCIELKFLYSWFCWWQWSKRWCPKESTHTTDKIHRGESRWRSPLPKGMCKVPWYFSQLV